MPVEDEQQVAVREGHRLVALVHQQIPRVTVGKNLVFFHQPDHRAVEIAQPRIAQESVFCERPLPPGVGVAPAVALAREVDPLGMPELVAHEVELFARMHVHIEIEGAQLGALFGVGAPQIVDDGLFAVHHLVVAQGQQVQLVVEVVHAEQQLTVGVRPLPEGGGKIVQRVVHPAHVPLVVKAQAAVLDGSRDLREARRVLGDQNGRRGARLQTGVHALQKFQRRAVDAAVRVALPVDQAGHGIHAQAGGVEHPQPVVGAGLDKAADLTAGVHKVAAAPLALAHRGGGVLIQRRTVKFF